MYIIRSAWSNLSHIGVDNHTDSDTRNTTTLTNQIVLVFMLFRLAPLILNLLKKDYTSSMIFAGMILALGVVFLCNYLRLYLTAKVILIMIILSYNYIVLFLFGTIDDGNFLASTYNQITAFTVFTLVFWRKAQSYLYFTIYSLLIINLLFYEQILSWISPGFTLPVFMAQNMSFWKTSMFIVMNTILICTTLKDQKIHRYREALIRLIRKINNQRQTQLQQTQQLNQQKLEIETFNKQLEDLVQQKTQTILEQHKGLLEYANINAHTVRGPLTRLMGLCLLIRDERGNYSDDEQKFMIDNILKSSYDLDREIHKVSEILDQAILKLEPYQAHERN